MGGEIGVESEKGAGSRFWFTALFREGDRKAPSPPPTASLSGTTVAVIDDNRTNRTILERYLSSWGMRDRAFESGRKALEEIRRSALDDPFEVAIVDMMMPGMDGAAVAAEIRADPALKDMVVILLTSAGHSEHPVPGIDVELVKPVRPSLLFDVLHSLLAAKPDHANRQVVDDGGQRVRPSRASLGARAGRRGQRRQPEGRGAHGREAWLPRRRRRQRDRGGAGPRRGALRRCVDGLPHAGDGRFRRDARDPAARDRADGTHR